MPGMPLEECRRMVAKSDALVVVVTRSYGSVPLGDTKERSFTWHEVETAKALRKPVFAFLLQPDASWTGPEAAEHERQLHAFIEYLRREFVCGEFSDSDDLARAVVKSLSAWLAEAALAPPAPSRDRSSRLAKAARLYGSHARLLERRDPVAASKALRMLLDLEPGLSDRRALETATEEALQARRRDEDEIARAIRRGDPDGIRAAMKRFRSSWRGESAEAWVVSEGARALARDRIERIRESRRLPFLASLGLVVAAVPVGELAPRPRLLVLAGLGALMGRLVFWMSDRFLSGVHATAPAFCRACRSVLPAAGQIPVLAGLLRTRCKVCRTPSPRGLLLAELLCLSLWFLIGLRGHDGPWSVTAAWLLALTSLLVVAIVNYGNFEIPDEFSIGGMLLSPLIVALAPALMRKDWLAGAFDSGGEIGAGAAFLASVCGVVAGLAWTLGLGWAGKRFFGQSPVGLGDVKAFAAMGGLVGIRGLAWMAAYCAAYGVLVGTGNLLRFVCLSQRRARARNGNKPLARSIHIWRGPARYLASGPMYVSGMALVLLW